MHFHLMNREKLSSIMTQLISLLKLKIFLRRSSMAIRQYSFGEHTKRKKKKELAAICHNETPMDHYHRRKNVAGRNVKARKSSS